MAKVRVTPQTWNFKSFMSIDGQHKFYVDRWKMAKVRVTPQTWNFKSFMRPMDGQTLDRFYVDVDRWTT